MELDAPAHDVDIHARDLDWTMEESGDPFGEDGFDHPDDDEVESPFDDGPPDGGAIWTRSVPMPCYSRSARADCSGREKPAAEDLRNARQEQVTGADRTLRGNCAKMGRRQPESGFGGKIAMNRCPLMSDNRSCR